MTFFSTRPDELLAMVIESGGMWLIAWRNSSMIAHVRHPFEMHEVHDLTIHHPGRIKALVQHFLYEHGIMPARLIISFDGPTVYEKIGDIDQLEQSHDYVWSIYRDEYFSYAAAIPHAIRFQYHMLVNSLSIGHVVMTTATVARYVSSKMGSSESNNTQCSYAVGLYILSQ